MDSRARLQALHQLLAQARARLDQGAPSEALPLAQAALDLDPDYLAARALLDEILGQSAFEFVGEGTPEPPAPPPLPPRQSQIGTPPAAVPIAAAADAAPVPSTPVIPPPAAARAAAASGASELWLRPQARLADEVDLTRTAPSHQSGPPAAIATAQDLAGHPVGHEDGTSRPPAVTPAAPPIIEARARQRRAARLAAQARERIAIGHLDEARSALAEARTLQADGVEVDAVGAELIAREQQAARRPRRRQPALAALVALLVVASAGVFTWSWLDDRPNLFARDPAPSAPPAVSAPPLIAASPATSMASGTRSASSTPGTGSSSAAAPEPAPPPVTTAQPLQPAGTAGTPAAVVARAPADAAHASTAAESATVPVQRNAMAPPPVAARVQSAPARAAAPSPSTPALSPMPAPPAAAAVIDTTGPVVVAGSATPSPSPPAASPLRPAAPAADDDAPSAAARAQLSGPSPATTSAPSSDLRATLDTPPPVTVPSGPAAMGNAAPAAAPASVAPGPAAVAPAGVAPAAPTSAAPPPAAAIPASPQDDERQVRDVLQRYRRAYDALDATSAQGVWPSVDARGLARAFADLSTQELRFDNCGVQVDGGAASAVCRGSARYVTKVGGQDPHVESRVWTFALRKRGTEWVIASARVQRP